MRKSAGEDAVKTTGPSAAREGDSGRRKHEGLKGFGLKLLVNLFVSMVLNT